MSGGSILYAVHNDTWVLRLSGDVRAPWCASLDALLERMFDDSGIVGVVVDLREATNIDSTILGLLAKIAVRSREKLNRKPVLMAPNPDIRRLLDSMCMENVFRIADDAVGGGYECTELPAVDRPEAEVCRQVTDAHRVLMDIDERNRAVFHDVVATLEDQQRTANGR